ncbi:flagellar FliJ family protein [Microbacterium sp. STN6]|uniref:flagellar FliJ family protein n=1 Tax=Microbacterium sp. STN6 TaxID=2995588 RepID=UPI002260855E|nr:flagellar FliJ family protein [Microbacterium sp. STN6]MCX7522383.1 flagellar FliJ family protein [Microbacterium sp. STN6]
MAPRFSLAGLLRLRHLQQDQAAASLGAAHALLRENSERHTRVRAALRDTASDPTSVAALSAIAAARASTLGMVQELGALGRVHESAVADAQETYEEARSRSIGLEKLEAKHDALVVHEELREEQAVIDEIASTSWHRKEGES